MFNGYAAYFLIMKNNNAYDPAAVMVSFHLDAVFMEIYTLQCSMAVWGQGHCQLKQESLEIVCVLVEAKEENIASGGAKGKNNTKSNNGMAEGNDLWWRAAAAGLSYRGTGCLMVR